MTEDQNDLQAGLFSVGVLTGDDYRAAASRFAGDEDFVDGVAAWDARLAPLAATLAPVAPSDGLLARIESRIDAMIVHCSVKREAEGEWIAWGEGVRYKILHQLPEINRQTMLLEMQPGSEVGHHDHNDDEECYVISGDISFGDAVLGPGDVHIAPKGSRHGPSRSVKGCLCLITNAIN